MQLPKAVISLLKSLAFLGVWAVVLGIGVAVLLATMGPRFADHAPGLIALESIGAGGLLLALVMLALFVDKRGLGTVGFNLSSAPVGLILGALIGAAIFMLPMGVLVALGAARLAPQMGAFSWAGLGLAAFYCFINVVHQELLVRSYIFQDIWAKYGPLAATLVTTALFVALHAGAIRQGVPGLIAGANVLLASLLMSLAYVRTRQLWAPIGIHFGWNGLQGPVLGVNVTGTDIGLGDWHVFEFPGPDLLTGGAMGVEGSLVGLMGPIAGVALVMAWPQMKAPAGAHAR